MTGAELATFAVEVAGRRLGLQSDSGPVRRHWKAMFAGMPLNPAGPTELALRVWLVDHLPPLPRSAPFFSDMGNGSDAPRPDVAAYRTAEGAIALHFPDGAVLALNPDDPLSPEAWVTPSIFRHGRIEDVTMAALSAGLRRFGAYVLHAFSATAGGAAVLLVGASGSGKTTTGLNLLAHGWRYLANDLALLGRSEGRVTALPSPGGFSIRPETLALLPGWRRAAGRVSPSPEDGKFHVPATRLVAGWSAPAPVAAVVFPAVGRDTGSQLRPVSPAIALARLMAESVDRWDESALTDHVAMLEALSAQAPAYALELGGDFDVLPGRLERLLHEEHAVEPERRSER